MKSVAVLYTHRLRPTYSCKLQTQYRPSSRPRTQYPEVNSLFHLPNRPACTLNAQPQSSQATPHRTSSAGSLLQRFQLKWSCLVSFQSTKQRTRNLKSESRRGSVKLLNLKVALGARRRVRMASPVPPVLRNMSLYHVEESHNVARHVHLHALSLGLLEQRHDLLDALRVGASSLRMDAPWI